MATELKVDGCDLGLVLMFVTNFDNGTRTAHTVIVDWEKVDEFVDMVKMKFNNWGAM